eukprot:TRINITY_DN17933_c0_g3_i1.p1 TRINITY_DN17933_c0_g3~~TRINITY_DN17933_c0_g3_i1.p1  ORF type:complete len:383 (-),score=65.64 TRINITY_DN17933_c0_g3_i1:1083-2231(-)
MNDMDFAALFNQHEGNNPDNLQPNAPPYMLSPQQNAAATMPKSHCSGDNTLMLSDMGEQVIMHPLYPDLVKAIMDCRKVGGMDESRHHIQIRTEQVLEDLHRKREQYQITGRMPAQDPELDQFLRQYIQVLDELHAELLNINREADNILHMFTTQIAEVINMPMDPRSMHARNAFNAQSNIDMTWFEIRNEQEQRVLLKQKYRQELLALKEEFSKRKKRGKLPTHSIEVLKSWWKEHIAWPYPTDSAKRSLASQTNLTSIQINNWFINQRKRHWHKLFPEGVPNSQEEALRSLKARGMLGMDSSGPMRLMSMDIESQETQEVEQETEDIQTPNEFQFQSAFLNEHEQMMDEAGFTSRPNVQLPDAISQFQSQLGQIRKDSDE